MADESSPWKTVKEVCQRVKFGRQVVYREIKAGRLRAARIGGRGAVRVHDDWIDEWLIASAKPVEVH